MKFKINKKDNDRRATLLQKSNRTKKEEKELSALQAKISIEIDKSSGWQEYCYNNMIKDLKEMSGRAMKLQKRIENRIKALEKP